MQGLCKNRRKIWYANHSEDVEVIRDEMRTGHYKTVYGPVQEMWTNVSTTSGLTNNNITGKVQREEFGQYNDYTLTINPLPPHCDMTETSVLWIDCTPEIDGDGMTDTPYDHVVVRIAEALNWRAAQAQKVERTHNPTAVVHPGW